MKSKNEREMGAEERARCVGGGAGGHPRLDGGNPLFTQANKPARIKVATNKVGPGMWNKLTFINEIETRVSEL